MSITIKLAFNAVPLSDAFLRKLHWESKRPSTLTLDDR